MKKDFTEYDVLDFLKDSSFIRWMRHEDKAHDALWERWIKMHPEQAGIIEEAKIYYQQLVSFEAIRPEEGATAEVWAAIEKQVRQHDGNGKMRLLGRPVWLTGSIALLFVLGGLVYNQMRIQTPEWVVIQSAGGQKSVWLPDSSEVLLDSNTTLKYHLGNERTVWLEGQAFFKVQHSGKKEAEAVPFTVHAGVETVTVLGTSFNVKTVDSVARIVLVSGKIRAAVGEKVAIMHPGEKLSWKQNAFHSHQVDPQLYLAWKSGEFDFHRTTLNEIKQLIKEVYGYDLVIKNEDAVTRKTISGKVNAADEKVLWNTLAFMFNGQVKKEGTKVILTIHK